MFNDAITLPKPLLPLATSRPKRPPIYQPPFHVNKGEISISKGLYELLALGSPAGVASASQDGQFYITRSDAANTFNVRTQSQPKFGVVTVTITSKPTVNCLRAQLGEPEATPEQATAASLKGYLGNNCRVLKLPFLSWHRPPGPSLRGMTETILRTTSEGFGSTSPANRFHQHHSVSGNGYPTGRS